MVNNEEGSKPVKEAVYREIVELDEKIKKEEIELSSLNKNEALSPRFQSNINAARSRTSKPETHSFHSFQDDRKSFQLRRRKDKNSNFQNYSNINGESITKAPTGKGEYLS